MRKRWLVTVAMMCSLTALQGQTTDIEARLKKSAPDLEQQLHEVVVTGTGTQHLLKDAPVQTEVISGKALRSFLLLSGSQSVNGQSKKKKPDMQKDTVALQGVTVVGKTNTQRLREGALSVNAIDVRSMASSIHSISELVDRTAGVKIREEGGMGSDFDLSINGMTGSSVRYFLTAYPWTQKVQGSRWPIFPSASLTT